MDVQHKLTFESIGAYDESNTRIYESVKRKTN